MIDKSKHSAEKVVLLAILFKMQYGDKTIKEVFPDMSTPNVKISELCIKIFEDLTGRTFTVDFEYKKEGIFYVSDHCPNYPGDVVVMVEDFNKLISFEDNV